MTRGQTTLDFLVGTSTFLIAIGLIVAFVPGMIDPFTIGTEGHSVLADRAVDSLAESELAAPGDPYDLDGTAVETVLGNTDDATVLRNRLGISDSVSINASLENSSGQLRYTGPAPPDTRSVTSTWRVVTYEGERAELIVRVW